MKKIFLEGCEKKMLINASREANKNSFHLEKKEPPLKEEVLEEGIKFFKTSSRLYKLADKFNKKSEKNPGLLPTARKLTKLADKFEYVEDLYDTGRKTEAKVAYKELKEKYIDLLKILQKETNKEILKKAGLLATTIASMVVPYLAMNKLFPSLSFTNVNNAAVNATFKDQAGLYLKRAGAFTLCGLPVKFMNSAFNSGITNYETKILKSVDRLLKDNEAVT